jgi:hypothetical protein
MIHQGDFGLKAALMCLVDFRGHRLTAQSLLPISGDSLVYGSCDAGNNVREMKVAWEPVKR